MEHVKIKMLETKLGSPDGMEVKKYVEGERYTVPSDLANLFISEGWAKGKAVKQDVDVIDVDEEDGDNEDDKGEDEKTPSEPPKTFNGGRQYNNNRQGRR